MATPVTSSSLSFTEQQRLAEELRVKTSQEKIIQLADHFQNPASKPLTLSELSQMTLSDFVSTFNLFSKQLQNSIGTGVNADLKIEVQQQQIAAQQQMAAEERDTKMQIETLKSNTSIEVAMINAQSKQVDNDVDDDGIDDTMELQKLDIERQKLMHTMNKDMADIDLKKGTLNAAIEKQRVDAQLKEKEIEVKRIAANKPKPSSK